MREAAAFLRIHAVAGRSDSCLANSGTVRPQKRRAKCSEVGFVLGQMSIREVRLPEDRSALEQLDTSMTTDVICAVSPGPTGFAIQFVHVAPLTKTYSVDDWTTGERLWDAGWVAFAGGRLAGFVATRYESWNRRLAIWHLYVDATARRRGIARSLLETAFSHGRRQGALTAWLEVTSVNAPAVRAYEALGFTLCGLDLTLYSHTEDRGEVALFMAKSLT